MVSQVGRKEIEKLEGTEMQTEQFPERHIFTLNSYEHFMSPISLHTLSLYSVI